MMEDFWMGMMMRVMRLIHGNVLNDGGFFDLAGQLEHGVEGAAAGEGDVFDGAHDNEQGVGVEQVQLLRGEQDEEGRRPQRCEGIRYGRKAMELT